MHQSERNRWQKIQRALLLAASDMEQAAAAAKALDAEEDDYNLMRALETAIAVCYSRVFTQSSLYRLDASEYAPDDPRLADLHRGLLELRDKAYAHTDKDAGRSASVSIDGTSGKALPATIHFMRAEEWVPLALPDVVKLCEVQRASFHDLAGKIELVLQGEEGLARHWPPKRDGAT